MFTRAFRSLLNKARPRQRDATALNNRGTQEDRRARGLKRGRLTGAIGWLGALLLLGATAQAQATVDYDSDDDGLIAVSSLTQLNAIRWDPNGDGASTNAGYATAFPNAATGMGCPTAGCTGYELTTDLDFDTNGSGAVDAGDDYWNSGLGWDPIGYWTSWNNSTTNFRATFEGNDHTITHLFINRPTTDYIGLFGLTEGSVIRNLDLRSVDVTGSFFVGGLVGHNSSGTITASSATGSVSGDYNVGGLVGRNWYGPITASSATGSVSGTYWVGGLAGRNSRGTITASSATGSVSGSRYVGGLVGDNRGPITASYATGSVSGTGTGQFVGGLVGLNFSGPITASYATGSVSGTGSSVGGLVGGNYSSGLITASSATGSVSGTYWVGGLVGANSAPITASSATGNVSGTGYVGGLVGQTYGPITASYATGSVSGTSSVGGLVGNNQPSSPITASYATGSVSGTTDVGGLVGLNFSSPITASYATGSVSGTGSLVGGLVGLNYGTITASYWDTQTTGQATSAGGTGKTTSQLQSPTGYTGIYLNWNVDIDNADGDDTLATGGDTPWDFGTASQYPMLVDFNVPGAPGSVAAQVGNAQVTLTWTAAADNGSAITTYQYQQQAGTGTFEAWTAIPSSAPGGTNATSYTVTGLTNGTTYTFQVRAVNGIPGATSASVTATPATVPGAPGSVAATAGNTQVTLTWTVAADNGAAITTYQYQQQAGSGTFSAWTAIPSSAPGETHATSYTVTGLTNGTTYTFQVRAVNSVGNGATSASATATPGLPGAPGSPGATAGDEAVTLSWTAAADHGSAITTYQYQQHAGDGTFGAWTAIPSSAPGETHATSYTVTGLTNGTTYTFQVRAVNSVGPGATSASATATPGLPGAPGSPGATAGDEAVTLSWTAAADHGAAITTYQYQQQAGAGVVGAWTTIPSSAPGGTHATSYTVTGLTNGTAYTFQVRAVNSVGNGAAATPVTATPVAVPEAPATLDAQPGNAQVPLTWTTAADNGSTITKYQYQQHAGSGTFGTWTDISSSAPGGTHATSYTVTGLTNGTTYTFQVRAVNSVGNGATSASATATPGLPGAPGSPGATAGDEAVTLSWTAAADHGAAITTYQYQQQAGAGVVGAWTTIPSSAPGGTHATSYTVTGLTNGTTYTFQVRAVNSVGNGAAAGAVTATPVAVPEAPGSLGATAGDEAVTLSWTAAVDNGAALTTYQYQQQAGSGSVGAWTAIPTSAPGETNATSYTVTGLTNGTTYTFQVRAVNSVGNGAASGTVTATPGVDYDLDDDGLMAVSSLAQLNAMRWDLDGDGVSSDAGYATAFPNAASGMGCPTAQCTGYELTTDLDFDTNGSGAADAGDAYWNSGVGWAPVGPFQATFEGNGHTLTHLFINRPTTDDIRVVRGDRLGERHPPPRAARRGHHGG